MIGIASISVDDVTGEAISVNGNFSESERFRPGFGLGAEKQRAEPKGNLTRICKP
jgi:hypothetical protein